jgi:hypothetical protein
MTNFSNSAILLYSSSVFWAFGGVNKEFREKFADLDLYGKSPGQGLRGRLRPGKSVYIRRAGVIAKPGKNGLAAGCAQIFPNVIV